MALLPPTLPLKDDIRPPTNLTMNLRELAATRIHHAEGLNLATPTLMVTDEDGRGIDSDARNNVLPQDTYLSAVAAQKSHGKLHVNTSAAPQQPNTLLPQDKSFLSPILHKNHALGDDQGQTFRQHPSPGYLTIPSPVYSQYNPSSPGSPMSNSSCPSPQTPQGALDLELSIQWWDSPSNSDGNWLGNDLTATETDNGLDALLQVTP
ncbi:hypothetical protein HMN09_01002100 [Mycena chlorophos]|uniref:Uncharacterized protein n=1 Tax=Mycena chlorophos TaxID=658473 RepID=A0A8H6SIF1_MYCCL|nr:hypothetical protein HMN09_01002100 [Mycena chlorophos]